MSTLYLSDLDGTLLNSEQRISEKSCEILNKLIDNGLLFSYATARSAVTSVKATAGLSAKIPIVVYNGVFTIDSGTGERILSNMFSRDDALWIYDVLLSHDINPIVYSIINGVEKFSYIDERCTTGMREFLNTRKNDVRERIAANEDEMREGEIFYFTCIDNAEKLFPACTILEKKFRCIFDKDIYSGNQWLEILPKDATKANAALELKKHFGCDRLVVFGDGTNDIQMFEAADECYAVANASSQLKALADSIIGSNNEDSVARFILEDFEWREKTEKNFKKRLDKHNST
ncbi:MAG: HAD family hydrolase [Oscillospiraceae bacterium]|nr:HAD family hydrolase [Oscillospiraceae bacterium]